LWRERNRNRNTEIREVHGEDRVDYKITCPLSTLKPIPSLSLSPSVLLSVPSEFLFFAKRKRNTEITEVHGEDRVDYKITCPLSTLKPIPGLFSVSLCASLRDI